MPSMARDQYLATQILTAAPEKLHLMLVEAAIALAERGRGHWRHGEDVQAVEVLSRATAAAAQLLEGLDRRAAPALTGKLAAIYSFIHRALTEANLRRDEKKLDEALRVLHIERDTWRQLCAQKAQTPPDEAAQRFRVDSPAHPGRAAYAPGPVPASPDAGFSVEA